MQLAAFEALAVCACGCPVADHEGYEEDGEDCGRDGHDCYRTSQSALAELTTLRAQAGALVTLREEHGRIEAVIRSVFPVENSEDGDPLYVCMNENGDVWMEADTLADAVEQLVGAMTQLEDRLHQRAALAASAPAVPASTSDSQTLTDAEQ